MSNLPRLCAYRTYPVGERTLDDDRCKNHLFIRRGLCHHADSFAAFFFSTASPVPNSVCHFNIVVDILAYLFGG